MDQNSSIHGIMDWYKPYLQRGIIMEAARYRMAVGQMAEETPPAPRDRSAGKRMARAIQQAQRQRHAVRI